MDLSHSVSIWKRLRQRKLVQWAVAYLAGAWLLLEIVDVVGGRFGLVDGVYRGFVVVAGVGLLAVLVLAWYHGEKGRQRVSGPELLILTLLFAVGGGLLTMVGRGRVVEVAASEGESDSPIERLAGRLALDDRPGIAVLPFAHRSGIEEDRYFTDGLHDELLTRLTAISGLRVIARTSVEPYRDRPKDVRDIGDELGVGYVLEGGVQRGGDRIRLSVQLIDAESGGHLWSETYDSDATPAELLDVQTQLSLGLAAELQVAVGDEERQRLYRRSTHDPEAYDLWLRVGAGGFTSPERRSTSIDYLTQAVALDPDFVAAHYQLVNLHATQYQFGIDRTEERGRLARESLERVTALAPGSSWERMARAVYAYRILRDFEGALEAIRGFEDELAHVVVGLRLRAYIERRLGHFENALSFLERSLTVDPHSSFGWDELARTLVRLERYDEAEEILRSRLTQEVDPGFVDRLENELSRVLLYRDADFSGAREIQADPGVEDALPWAFHERDTRRMRATLSDVGEIVVESQYTFEPASLWLAWAALIDGDSIAALGLFEDALGELEVAIQERPGDDRRHRALGLAYAGLGRAEEAVHHGARALELLPPEHEAMDGPYNVRGMARIHAQLGNVDETLAWLEDYFSRPRRESARWLELDPLFDPIRNDPRFDDLIERYWPEDAEPRPKGP